MASSAEEVAKYTKTCILVFYALLVLTVVTVAVSFLEMSVGPAIALGLFIAIVKGSLVSWFFMHLSAERKAIYWTLALTLLFFFDVLLVPLLTHLDSFGTTNVYGP